MAKGCLITIVLFALLAFSRLYVQPFFSLISDCDETFNYWEPLNFLLRGFGKQTWEYSPEYSIRSWAFLLPLYGFLKPFHDYSAEHNFPSYFTFYLARALLGLGTLLMELFLFTEIKSTLSLTTAQFWLFFQLFNAGWFHASVELLPSSFGMVTFLGSMAFGLRYLSTGSSTPFVLSLLCNFIGGILGWPFVLVLSVPLVLHFLFNHKFKTSVNTGIVSSIVLVIVLYAVFSIDSLFYGQFTPVAWNIVMYNVIGANENSGPNIFGVEPWFYYFLNLLLNFPLPVLFFCLIGLSNYRLWPIWMSLVAWMTTFLMQPHKEERFLYPVYGIITLAASVGTSMFTELIRKPRMVQRIFHVGLCAAVIAQSLLRICALVKNYTAPLEVYSNLTDNQDSKTVCVGREWYHFPASFFLPDNHRLGFVSSGFDGLLPGDFAESDDLFESIRAIPDSMNNENKFDPGKLTDLEKCDFYVDFMLESDNEKDSLDPTSLPENWRPVVCKPFVDIPQSKFFGRAFLLPQSLIDCIPSPLKEKVNSIYGAQYLEYCLFEKQQESV
ncbi:LAFE_0H02586g1_1 [Lachancea fermentati]|uniref:Mannosyltransferase n=1 Tax=Lachancea fermentati TaxID=4955 RepID=A0A1G4MJ97_LACFM|nr:LAFE_0H02586g1_1 [Lachancea fermentati]